MIKLKYEYKEIIEPRDTKGYLSRVENFNLLGNEGWEFCAHIDTTEEGKVYLFKRIKN